MKKILITALILSMTSVLLIACDKNTGNSNNNTDSSIVENDQNIEENDEDKDDAEEEETDIAEDNKADEDIDEEDDAKEEEEQEQEEEEVNLSEEQVKALAADLCNNYYSYEIKPEINEEHNGVKYYYVEVNVGPPDELIKKFMIGSDGHLYKYDDVQNGIFEAVR